MCHFIDTFQYTFSKTKLKPMEEFCFYMFYLSSSLNKCSKWVSYRFTHRYSVTLVNDHIWSPKIGWVWSSNKLLFLLCLFTTCGSSASLPFLANKKTCKKLVPELEYIVILFLEREFSVNMLEYVLIFIFIFSSNILPLYWRNVYYIPSTL